MRNRQFFTIAVRMVFAALVVLLPEGLAQPPQDWKNLFDGKTLDGWVQRGGTARYEIVEDFLQGTSRTGTPNSFLCTAEEYRDFELQLEVWVDDGLNSGIQIRSQSRPDYQDGVVHGLQVEVDPSDRGYTGGIYDEARSGWLQTLDNNPEARNAFRRGTWNHLRIRAEGTHIQTWVNGVAAVDMQVQEIETGFIALQVHSVDDGAPPLHVRWKNLRLRPLHQGQDP